MSKVLGVDILATEEDNSVSRISLLPDTEHELPQQMNLEIFRPPYLMIYVDVIEQSLVSGIFTYLFKFVQVKKVTTTLVSISIMKLKFMNFINYLILLSMKLMSGLQHLMTDPLYLAITMFI